MTDGTQNLIGALRQSMAALGARTIADMHDVEIVYAPSVVDRGQVLAARPLGVATGTFRGREVDLQCSVRRASSPGMPRAASAAANPSRSSVAT